MTTITLPLWLAWVVCGTCFLYTIRCIVEAIARTRAYMRAVEIDRNRTNLVEVAQQIMSLQQRVKDAEHEEQR